MKPPKRRADDDDDWELENTLMTSAQVGSVGQLTEYEKPRKPERKKGKVRMGFHPPRKAYHR